MLPGLATGEVLGQALGDAAGIGRDHVRMLVHQCVQGAGCATHQASSNTCTPSYQQSDNFSS